MYWLILVHNEAPFSWLSSCFFSFFPLSSSPILTILCLHSVYLVFYLKKWPFALTQSFHSSQVFLAIAIESFLIMPFMIVDWWKLIAIVILRTLDWLHDCGMAITHSWSNEKQSQYGTSLLKTCARKIITFYDFSMR